MSYEVLKSYPAAAGGQYEVRKEENGELYCTCSGWKFSEDRPRLCKHIRDSSPDTVRAAEAHNEERRLAAIAKHDEHKRRLHYEAAYAHGYALAENREHDRLAEYESALRSAREEGRLGDISPGGHYHPTDEERKATKRARLALTGFVIMERPANPNGSYTRYYSAEAGEFVPQDFENHLADSWGYPDYPDGCGYPDSPRYFEQYCTTAFPTKKAAQAVIDAILEKEGKERAWPMRVVSASLLLGE